MYSMLISFYWSSHENCVHAYPITHNYKVYMSHMATEEQSYIELWDAMRFNGYIIPIIRLHSVDELWSETLKKYVVPFYTNKKSC